MKSFFALLALLVAAATAHHQVVHSMDQAKVKQLYDSIINSQYFGNVRPYGVNSTDYVTYVTLNVRDIEVINVDQTKGLFTFQAYFQKEWVDPRLAYNDTSVAYIPLKECRSLWTPDLFFLNGVDVSTFPKSYHHPTRDFKIFPNGRVFLSGRGAQTIYCPKIFDTSAKEFVCSVRAGSYGYFSDEVKIMLDADRPITTVKEISQVPNFKVVGVHPQPSCDEAKLRTPDEEGHTHSCVQVDFKFVRA